MNKKRLLLSFLSLYFPVERSFSSLSNFCSEGRVVLSITVLLLVIGSLFFTFLGIVAPRMIKTKNKKFILLGKISPGLGILFFILAVLSVLLYALLPEIIEAGSGILVPIQC